MSGLPWIKVWTVVGDHPKVQRLERELNLPDALGVVIRLWCWAADYHPGGDIPASDTRAMERVAIGPNVVTLSRVTVTQALVTAGFLDPVEGGFRVHDWAEMQTAHRDAAERKKSQARERQKKHREKTKRDSARDVTRDVTRDSVTEREKERETETTTYIQGAADREVIEAARGQPGHPLLDAVVTALRSKGIQPAYPANGSRASVEAAIREVSVSVAVERLVPAWDTSQPWLTFYLPVITGRAPKAKRPNPTNVNAPAGIGTEWGKAPF